MERDALTAHQRGIVALVAEGLTNAEIAERLGITENAVGKHVHRIGRRLGLRNRVEIAVWAVHQGLHRPGR